MKVVVTQPYVRELLSRQTKVVRGLDGAAKFGSQPTLGRFFSAGKEPHQEERGERVKR